MKILFAGDLFVSDDYQNRQLIDRSVVNLFQEVDFSIANLETPVTKDDPAKRIPKTGPHLRTIADTIRPILEKLDLNMVTLANNHIMDYGVDGLINTIEFLDRNKIKHVGAGRNLDEASKYITLTLNDLKVSCINFSENEWASAEEGKAGANPLDVVDNICQLKEAKQISDFVICVFHGGNEYYQFPSPRMKKQLRFFIDNGADAIFCHHTHCTSGYEIYKDKPIFYGLGNFIFTRNSKFKEWYIGLSVILVLQRNEQVKFSLHPIRQEKGTFVTKSLQGEELNSVLKDLDKINEVIINDTLLKNRWNEFIENSYKSFANVISPASMIKNKHIRGVINHSGASRILFNNEYCLQLLNYIRCESHLEGLRDSLKEIIRRKNG